MASFCNTIHRLSQALCYAPPEVVAQTLMDEGYRPESAFLLVRAAEVYSSFSEVPESPQVLTYRR